MNTDTTPRTERVSKFEFMAQCRRAIIAAGWPTGSRLLYQTAAEMCWPSDRGWVLPYSKGFSQRTLAREAGIAKSAGCRAWVALFHAGWFELTSEGPMLTPHRGHAPPGKGARAPGEGRTRPRGGAQRAPGEGRTRPRGGAQRAVDPICISDSQINTPVAEAGANAAAAADRFAGIDEEAIWSAVVATVPRVDETQRAAIVREIIATVSHSHRLTYTELIRYTWAAARELPATMRMGRWRNLIRTTPDENAIGRWREVSAKPTTMPAAMVEAKPDDFTMTADERAALFAKFRGRKAVQS